MKRKLLPFTVATMLIGLLMGCSPETMTTTTDAKNESAFEETYDNPLKDRDMGGSNVLSLAQQGDEVTLENEHIRLILDAKNGGIRQIANKQANVYLVDIQAAKPFTLCFVGDAQETSQYENCTVSLVDGAEVKTIRICWQITDRIYIRASVSLAQGDNDLQFDLEIENDVNHPVLYVQYPIVEQIDTLYQRERDYLAHPFATGYLFRDPLTNFNDGECAGISRDDGLYPSGWESPMQFFAYYSQGIGGFLFRTDDGGTGIKSFSFTGQEGLLKAGIYHYADDVGEKSISFDYTTHIGNLTQGTWYEAADIYRQWAAQQSWTSMGTLSERADINREFYEDTVLCNFNFPYDTVYGTENQTALYEKIKGAADGKLLNIFFNADNFLTQSQKFGDWQIKFEFPDFHSVSSAEMTPEEWETAIISHRGKLHYYNVEGAMQFFECPATETYLDGLWERENYQLVYNKVSGFYHDVGIAAVHPRQCFDSTHAHRTRVNLIPEYLNIMKQVRDLATQSAAGLYGQELVFEQMLPYLDFYQARGNAQQVGWMENDRIRSLVENGSCEKISMFDYVYGNYGAVRVDGYLNADALIGESYYHIAAQTVLMGGVPEFNYEFVSNGAYLTVTEHSWDMLSYIGYLGNVRQGYGKNYLVYGEMVKAPLATDRTIEYDYIQQRTATGEADGGVITWSSVITSAYRWKDTIGVFVCNPTATAQEINFVIHAEKDYGIAEGTVTLVDETGEVLLCAIENGKATVRWNANARQVILLRLEAKK